MSSLVTNQRIEVVKGETSNVPHYLPYLDIVESLKRNHQLSARAQFVSRHSIPRGCARVGTIAITTGRQGEQDILEFKEDNGHSERLQDGSCCALLTGVMRSSKPSRLLATPSASRSTWHIAPTPSQSLTSNIHNAYTTFCENIRRQLVMRDPRSYSEICDNFYGERLNLSRLAGRQHFTLMYKSRIPPNLCSSLGHYPDTIIYDSDTEQMYQVPVGDGKFLRAFECLADCLNGDEREIDFTSTVVTPVPSKYWDRVYESEDARIYNRVIYPLIIETLDSLVSDGLLEYGDELLDIMGGRGSLSGQLKDKFRPLLIDANAENCRAARGLLSDNGVLCADVRTLKSLRMAERDGFQIGVCCGGMTQGVLTRQEALNTLVLIAGALESGGILIVTGRTACYINSRDLEEHGFDVMNMTCPTDKCFPYRDLQMYVARAR